MKNILMLIATIAVCTTAFYRPKCEHVFTQVEQPVIKVERPSLSGSIGIFSLPSGIQDGKDIICVKCFQVQKQKIDYGPDPCWDTARSEGGLFLTVDTLQWIKAEPIK